MNKTVNINLGGMFFHIDEIAFLKLKKYLDAVRRSLSDDPKGKDEIINDIEARIGEILSENIKDVRQVVNEQDIDGIINIMGRPEDYADEDSTNNYQERNYQTNYNKKLYRDTDDKFLGGVASGLAHYFGIDVIWSRLVWILALSSGVGFLVYLLLWILLPQANTTAEKLEMEGEAVNINNIEKKIREEFNHVSSKLKDGIDDVQEHIKKNDYQTKVKSGLQEIIDTISKIFTVLFKVIGKFAGVFLIFISGAMIIGVIVGIFTAGSVGILGIGDGYMHFPEEFYDSRIPIWMIGLFLLILVIIPVIVLFMLGLKILSKNVRSFNRYTKLTLLGIWLVALMGMTFIGVENSAKSSTKGFMVEKQSLKWNKDQVLEVKMIEKEDLNIVRKFDKKFIEIDGEKNQYGNNIRLNIKKSNNNIAYVKVYKNAYAFNNSKAKEKASLLMYHLKIVDNQLLLDNYFITEYKNRFGDKNIRVTLYLPKGAKVYIDKSLKHSLGDDTETVQNLSNRKMIKHNFIMADEELNCLDCKNYEATKTSKTNQVDKKETKESKPVKKIKTIHKPKKVKDRVSETEDGLIIE